MFNPIQTTCVSDLQTLTKIIGERQKHSVMASLDDIFWIALTLIGAVIFVVNALIVATFFRFRTKILRRNNRILLSLAFADLFVGLFSITFAASMLTNQDRSIFKSLGNIPLFTSMFVSIFSLILLTCDRLLAIVKPLRYPAVATSKRMRRCIISIWLLVLSLLTQQYILYFCFDHELELKIRGMFTALFSFLGATVLAITNTVLYGAVRRQKAKLNSDYNPTAFHTFNRRKEIRGTSADSDEFSMKMRGKKARKLDLAASKECVFIVVIFLCSMLPLSIYRLLFTSGLSLNHAHTRRTFLLLALLSSLINPWIYFLRKKQFKKYLVLRTRRSMEDR